MESSHKISTLACTTGCDLSCNEDCDSCNSACDDDCDGSCDTGCDCFGHLVIHHVIVMVIQDVMRHVAMKMQKQNGYYICKNLVIILQIKLYTPHHMHMLHIYYHNSSNENDCTKEYISVYEDYLDDTFDKLEGIFVDSYNTGLSLSVRWIDTDNSKSVLVGIMQTDNETLFTISESNRILSLSNDFSCFGAIGFWWYCNDITELNNFDDGIEFQNRD